MILVDIFMQLYDGAKNKTFIYVYIDNHINFNLKTFSITKKWTQ